MPSKTRTETPIERIFREKSLAAKCRYPLSASCYRSERPSGIYDFAYGGLRMPNDEWIKTLSDGRRVKFTYQELDERAFITAQVERNKVVYSIILTKVRNPLSRVEVESQFEGELSKKSPKPN